MSSNVKTNQIMKTFPKPLTAATLCAAVSLLVTVCNLSAQDRPERGDFDPQQMRQRMIERMRDQLDVQDDAEWKAISDAIANVMDARRALGGPGFGPPGGPGGPGGGGFRPPPDGGPDGAGAGPGPGGPGGPGGFRGGPGGFNRPSGPE